MCVVVVVVAAAAAGICLVADCCQNGTAATTRVSSSLFSLSSLLFPVLLIFSRWCGRFSLRFHRSFLPFLVVALRYLNFFSVESRVLLPFLLVFSQNHLGRGTPTIFWIDWFSIRKTLDVDVIATVCSRLFSSLTVFLVVVSFVSCRCFLCRFWNRTRRRPPRSRASAVSASFSSSIFLVVVARFASPFSFSEKLRQTVFFARTRIPQSSGLTKTLFFFQICILFFFFLLFCFVFCSVCPAFFLRHFFCLFFLCAFLNERTNERTNEREQNLERMMEGERDDGAV